MFTFEGFLYYHLSQNLSPNLLQIERSNHFTNNLPSVLDASGRIPQALTQGNKIDLGSYDQCVNIREPLATTTIDGKYCYSGLVIPTSLDGLSPAISFDDVVCSLICYRQTALIPSTQRCR